MNVKSHWFWVWLSSFILFSLLWWLLTQATPTLWTMVFLVLLASLTVALNWPSLNFGAIWRLPRFLAFFLPKVALGAIMVVWLVGSPQARLNPQRQTYSVLPSTERNPIVNAVFISCVCLTPGTVAWSNPTGSVSVHVLNTRSDWRKSLRTLESEVNRWLLGVCL